MSKGYVYVLSNPAMPGMYKIGKTVRDPSARARDLHQTGTPLPFKVEHWVLVPNCDDLEYTLHQRFEDDRISLDREFFSTDLDEICREMEDFARLQVEQLVEEYMPDHMIVYGDCFVDVGAFKRSFYKAAAEYDLCPPEHAELLYHLDGDDIKPAIVRYLKFKEERKAERQSAELKVVENG